MKKLRSYLIAVFTITTLTSTAGCTGLSNATVRVRVIDEGGKPIKGVRSELMSLSGDDSNSKLGLTDTNGMYSVHLKKIFYEVNGFFNKSGYYETKGQIWHWNQWGGVPPANTNFVIIMKRIIDPVPMIRKNVRAYFPRQNEPFGFDLEIGDWVFPDGKGKVADIYLTAEWRYVSNNDFTYNISAEFMGEYNGIQSFYVPSPENAPTQLLRSELPPPQIAPEIGYENEIKRFSQWLPADKRGTSSRDEVRRLIFRVRTILDDEGKIIFANYGWASQDMDIIAKPDGTAGFSIVYYYNPASNSRSLEPIEF